MIPGSNIGPCLPPCGFLRASNFTLFPGMCEFAGCLSRPVFSIDTIIVFGLTMRWNGLTISSPPTDCGGSSQYVITFPNSGLNRFAIDLVRAYSDGVWVSSTVIDLSHSNLNGTAPAPRSLRAAWGRCPAQQLTFPTSGGPRCATAHVATITIFDDGTFTLTP